MAESVSAVPCRCSWERRPGEPNLWFERFEVYRNLGPGRYLLHAYRLISNRPDAHKVPGSWAPAMAKWEWRKRILAWDDAEFLKARQAEAEGRAAARADRLKRMRGG